jgi:hypothetical protein
MHSSKRSNLPTRYPPPEERSVGCRYKQLNVPCSFASTVDMVSQVLSSLQQLFASLKHFHAEKLRSSAWASRQIDGFTQSFTAQLSSVFVSTRMSTDYVSCSQISSTIFMN